VTFSINVRYGKKPVESGQYVMTTQVEKLGTPSMKIHLVSMDGR